MPVWMVSVCDVRNNDTATICMRLVKPENDITTKAQLYVLNVTRTLKPGKYRSSSFNIVMHV